MPATKFTPETRNKILGALSVGATYREACEAAGVPVHTGWEWVRRGRAEDEEGRKTEWAKWPHQVAQAQSTSKVSVKYSFHRMATSGEEPHVTTAAARALERRSEIQAEALVGVWERFNEIRPGFGDALRRLYEMPEGSVIDVSGLLPGADAAALPAPSELDEDMQIMRTANEAEAAKALFLSFFEAHMPEHYDFVQERLFSRVYRGDDGKVVSLVGDLKNIRGMARNPEILFALFEPVIRRLFPGLPPTEELIEQVAE